MPKEAVSVELETLRHSTAHLLAAAVHQLNPDAQFGVGPVIRNGFYYDIDLKEHLREEQLPKVEKLMKKMVAQRIPFERIELPIEEAIEAMRQRGQHYKVELLELLRTKGSTAIEKETGDNAVIDSHESGELKTVSFYKLGDFVDLCRGPHVEHTGQLKQFKLTSTSGAYWRGDQNNPQLQRFYGIAFENKDELDHCLWQIEEAKKRDHRKLGKELGIFFLSNEVGQGLPMWLPNGAVIREELEQLAKEEEWKAGFKRVVTPNIAKADLYYTSGHLPYYKEDMYAPIKIDEEEFYLRPMNCPHHHKVFSSDLRSYRDLPLRIAEYGQVFRYEASGALSGLMRARGFCQNDAHIYCSEDQAVDEFVNVMHMHANYYQLFGIKNFHMVLAKPDLNKLDKYVNNPEQWLKALTIIETAMKQSGLDYIEAEGEAAFYGPKIDFVIESVLGTEFAISTNQLDFMASERFNLKYIGEDGQEHPVYVLHRAPLGSHERFVAFLLEHFGGAFPTWLAPIQIMIIPISDRHHDYCQSLKKRFVASGIRTAIGGLRVEVDTSSERMQKKIRNAQMAKVPYMIVIGDSEAESDQISVRVRSGETLNNIELEQFTRKLETEISMKALTLTTEL